MSTAKHPTWISRPFLVALVAILSALSSANAGIVVFEPGVVVVEQGEPAVVQMTIAKTDFPDFNYFDFQIEPGWFDYLISMSFAPSVKPHAVFGCPVFGPCFGSFSNRNESWQAPLLIGNLTVDTTRLSEGTHEFSIAEYSGIGHFLTLDHEPIFGSFSVQIVPEPCTAILVGLVAIACMNLPRIRRTEQKNGILR